MEQAPEFDRRMCAAFPKVPVIDFELQRIRHCSKKVINGSRRYAVTKENINKMMNYELFKFEEYCKKHSYPENKILEEIKLFTIKNEPAPQMISGPIVCNTLLMLIKSINAKKILEIGMFTGYSALYMAQGLDENGEIHTCEVMDRHIENAAKFFNK